MTRARLARDRPSRTSGCPDVQRRDLRRRLYAERLERLRERAGRRGYDRARRLRRPRAQRQPRLPDRASTRASRRPSSSSGRPATRPSSSATSATAWRRRRPCRCAAHLFQDLSLPSQPRDRSRPLADDPRRRGHPRRAAASASSAGRRTRAGDELEAPAFLVDELRGLAGPAGAVENATDLLIDAADGLRVINEVEQLAAFEYAACQTSDGVSRGSCAGLRPGMTEREAVRLLDWNGMPLSCHLDADGRSARDARAASARATGRSSGATRSRSRSASGARSTAGPASWSEDAPELPGGIGDYVERLVGAVLRGGRRVVRGAPRRPDGRRAAGDHRPPPRRPVLRHLPQPGPPDPPRRVGELARGSAARRSSCAPGWRSRSTSSRPPGTPYFTTNIEDGIALADAVAPRGAGGARTRTPGPASRRGAGSCARRSASSCTRTCCRSRTSRRYLPPFLLRPDRAMTLAG